MSNQIQSLKPVEYNLFITNYRKYWFGYPEIVNLPPINDGNIVWKWLFLYKTKKNKMSCPNWVNIKYCFTSQEIQFY